MDKKVPVVWLEDASSIYVSMCIGAHPSVSFFEAPVGTLMGLMDRRQPAV